MNGGLLRIKGSEEPSKRKLGNDTITDNVPITNLYHINMSKCYCKLNFKKHFSFYKCTKI